MTARVPRHGSGPTANFVFANPNPFCLESQERTHLAGSIRKVKTISRGDAKLAEKDTERADADVNCVFARSNPFWRALLIRLRSLMPST